MIVACPFCQTRFLLAASLFAAGPRQMVCAKCKHSWRSQAPVLDEAVSLPHAVSTNQASPAVEEHLLKESQPFLSSHAKDIVKIIMAVLGVVLLVWLVFDRVNIAKKLGFMEPIYDAIGLHIYHTGEGLNIAAVRSELVYEEGIMKLSIEGKIRNTTKKTLEIPPLLASAIASDGHVMQDWQIDAPAAKVEPGEDVPFHSSINAPKGTVADINLNFIEMKNDAAQ